MDKDKEKEELEIPPIELLREELAREEAKHSFRKTLWNIAVVLIVAAAITALAATRLFVLIRINGNSMEPTLADGEVIFLRQTKDIEAGDIIGFYYGGRVLLKRAIGSAGDQIDIDRDGNVYVNGQLLDEPYLEKKSLGKCELEFPYEVPEGMTFVLGDNRAVSIDSRIKSIGSVEAEQIVGKVVFRAWPLSRMEMMR
ncbi:MAG: signal peptidase I [Lachnospiraceae bacterium]|jgi:signal peptidase I|nr:signal peptidase I [Lachnospiraceae bacterium]